MLIGEYHIGGILIAVGIILFASIITIRNLKHEQKCFRNYAKMIKKKELKKKGTEPEQKYMFIEDEEETEEDRLEREEYENEEDQLDEEMELEF